ncbi:uncharacterized protein LOC109829770 isoform X3 [Asparagus officinalis]|uniref:uncharacterized protein LOC109829770 isoform X3 n=1 Tax=Asparagus officinalis TaxID=4686 RepID=UPI00098E1898|nr:uncharacterized protein LOC109829770 isoform X3 [Asparagus officinalis]
MCEEKEILSLCRGHLNLSLLSSSNMRISFTGDDGCTEKLAVLSNVAEASEVVVEEISADTSGRSFLIKLPGSEVLYFWCSEKSNDRGMELLAKMKNLLRRKPSLARLTGICESRLDSFATHIRAYLLGSSNTAEADLLSLSGESSAGVHASDTYFHSPPLFSKSSRCRFTAAHTTKGQPSHQGSLSPRPNTFKDGTARSSSSIRNNIKEKLKRRGDTHNSSFLSISQPSIPTVSTSCTQSSHQPEDETVRGSDSDSCSFLPSVTLSEMHCISSSPSSSIPLFLNLPSSLISSSNSLFSPYYCLCPPCPSALQYPAAPSRLPITFNESMPLPPLSSLLSASVPPVSLVTSSVPLSIPSLPTINLPSLFPESFARLSIPVTSFVTLPTSQQISTFSGYMSDPIVHTPVIDVCSSGQGYLVSAGPAMSSVMPPLLPSFVNHPLISSTESAVENSARETLRMLMASTPKFTYQKPMIVIPGTDGMNHNATVIPGSNRDVVADVGQGLYGGAFIDVEAVAMGLSSLGLSLSSSKVDGRVKIGKQERNDHAFTEESSED